MRRPSGPPGAFLLVAIAAMSAAAFAAFLIATTIADAGATAAQGSCNDDFGQFDVSTAAELNFAIDCFNSATSDDEFAYPQILLLNDIEVKTFDGDTVLHEITQTAAFEMQIEGNGHTIRRGSGAPTTPADIVRVAPTSGAELFVIETSFELGPADTSALRHDGSGSLRIWASVFSAGPSGTAATAIISGADVNEFNLFLSYIEGVPVGIEIIGDIYGIDASTINSTETDVVFVGLGLGIIANSTLAGPVGIRLGDGGIQVENSTILGDGAAAVGDVDGAALFTSSIVGSCSTALVVYDDPGPGVVDLGYNVGGCFDLNHVIDTELADNGCTGNPAVLGCVPTVALGFDSPARGAGECSDAFGDQRGFPRTPFGEGCDAGAFEGTACPPLQSVYEVGTAQELNFAIDCFNESDPDDTGIDMFTMSLTADIEADAVAENAVFIELNSPAYLDLVIQGNGHLIRRGAGAEAVELPILSLVMTSSSATTAINDLAVEVGNHDTAAIQSSGGFTFAAHRIAITAEPAGSSAAGLVAEAEPFGEVRIEDSIIEGVETGVQASGEAIFISGSTISSSGTDVVIADVAVGSVVNSTLAGPAGIRMNAGFIMFLAYSTVTGDAVPLNPDGLGSVRISSSVVATCSAPVAVPGPNDGTVYVDDGNNVGGCFAAGQTIDTELADNGCAEPTPAGCPRTIALSEDAAALGAGFCGDTDGGQITLDQRGEPRTPLGAGCDAGSFESPGFDPSAAVGDVDADGDLDTADVQALLDYLAKGELPAALNAADFNADGDIRLDDALALVQQVAAAG